MKSTAENATKILLHACCGPCTLEPSRLLSERGNAFDIFYTNSNIAPRKEYELRLDTLKTWAKSEDYNVIEGTYDHDAWIRECKTSYENGEISRQERCRRCYQLRFAEAAQFASENGYKALSTTLSVSPYQYTDTIREELETACANADIECVFEDFRPFYDEATRRSRNANMYRQNYCGCELSAIEAADEREQRRVERKREKELLREARADEIKAEEEKKMLRKKQRAQYDEERARRRKILKEIRQNAKTDSPVNSKMDNEI